jgi:hypothetical protein
VLDQQQDTWDTKHTSKIAAIPTPQTTSMKLYAITAIIDAHYETHQHEEWTALAKLGGLVGWGPCIWSEKSIPL